jgi:hypothetical protein
MREFSTHSVLWIRFGYAIAMMPATLFLAFIPLPRRLVSVSQRRFDISYLVLFAFVRILLFCVVFSILHLAPRGDVVGYYYPEAQSALHGGLAYRDFTSSYAPLFSYVCAALLRLIDSPLALIAFAIVLDVFAVPIWFAAIRPACEETVFRRGALLYLLQPLMLLNVAVDGGNNIWIALTIAAAMLYLVRSRDALSGMSYATSLIVVKFLPIIFAPLLFLSARRRLLWTAGFLLPSATVFGAFAAAHANILQPLQQEGNQELGGSLPLLVSYLTGFDIPGRLADSITVLALIGCTLACWRVTQIEGYARGWATGMGLLLLTLATLMLSKKSWTIYIIMVMFLLCQLIVRYGYFARLLYCLFSFLLIVEPSFLFDRVGSHHLPIHAMLLRGYGDAWLLMLMYLLELICCSWFAWLAIREVRRLAERAVRAG